MMKWPVRAVAGVLLSLLAACSSREEKKGQAIKLGTSSQATAAVSVGKSLCDLLEKPLTCKVVAATDGLHTLEAIDGGQLDVGVVLGDSLQRAWMGQKPFRGKIKKLRVLFSLHDETLTWVVQAKSGISLFQKSAGKRLNLGPEGSDSERLVGELFEGCKNMLDDVTVSRLAAPELAHAIQSQSVDGYMELMSHPDFSLSRTLLAYNLELVPVGGPCVTALAKAKPYFESTAIPGNGWWPAAVFPKRWSTRWCGRCSTIWMRCGRATRSCSASRPAGWSNPSMCLSMRGP
ncbi:MAG: TAXI family TRAP transporter solute-binding subunit [Magnetococcus sp. MYC-9]